MSTVRFGNASILCSMFKSSPRFCMSHILAFMNWFCNLLYISSCTLFGGWSCPGLGTVLTYYSNLGCVRESFDVARYQPKEFLVKIWSCVKKPAVREQKQPRENVFWVVIMPANTRFYSDPRFPWDCVTVTACVTHVLPVWCTNRNACEWWVSCASIMWMISRSIAVA